MPLRLRTFGSVYLTRDGESLTGAAGQRRLLAILTVVAAAGDQGISRDKLLALLWSEGEPDKSRHALTQSLYHIRKALGVERIFLSGGDLRLDSAFISSDVGDFQQALRECRLEDAVGYYTGPFVDGFYLNGDPEFDFWVSSARARFSRQAGDALLTLANDAKGRSDTVTELRWAEQLAAHDPLDGSAIARLVACLAAVGDRAGALQCARSYEERIRDELELPPDQAVVDVVAQLRRNSPSPVYGVPLIESDIQAAPVADGEAQSRDRQTVGTTEVAEPLSVPTASAPALTRFRRKIWLAGAVAAAAVAIIYGVARSHLAADHAEARASTIMVAPFQVDASDPITTDMSEGLLDLLTARIADADTKRAADPTRVLQAWARARTGGDTAVSVTAAARVAHDLGAGEALIGSVESAGGSVVVNASLVDVGQTRVKATARVRGSPDSLLALADRIVNELILKEDEEYGLLAPGDVTSSPSALRAFLVGRAAYRRADFYSAVRAYSQSITQDPNFTLAALGLAAAADGANAAEQHDRALAIAWERKDDLSPSDRAYLVAFAGPRYPEPSPAAEALAAWEQVVRVAPTRADGWHELGESFFFDGDLLGIRDAPARAADAFRHALRLDPSFAPARRMLTLLLARQGDTAELRRIVDTLGDADSADAMRVFIRWRSAQALRDGRALGRVRREFDDAPNSALRAIAMTSQFDGASIDDGDRAVEILRRRALSGAEALDMELARHSRALNSDDFAGALATTTRVGAAQPSLHPQLRLRVLDALYSNGDRDAARSAAEELNGIVSAPRPTTAPDTALRLADLCVLGQWRLATRDTAGARSAVRALRVGGSALPRFPVPVGANPAACAELLDVSLAIAERGAGARDRLAHLDSLMLSGPAVGDAMRYANLVIARHYRAIGDPARALAALQRRSYMRGWPRYRATGLRLLMEVALEVGDTATARSARQRLLSTHRRTKLADGSGAFVHRLRAFSHSLVH